MYSKGSEGKTISVQVRISGIGKTPKQSNNIKEVWWEKKNLSCAYNFFFFPNLPFYYNGASGKVGLSGIHCCLSVAELHLLCYVSGLQLVDY